MNHRSIPCPKCGQALKLLLTSFYCQKCDIDSNCIDSRSLGYVVVEKQWIDLSLDKVVPPGTPMHLYKTYQEAEKILKVIDFVAIVAEADLSNEGDVIWSTPYSHYVYTNKQGVKLSPR
jgi:hypothetical protein